MNEEDDMDVYLGRCLKNWVAQQPPAPNRRHHLLRAASYYNAQRKQPLPYALFSTFLGLLSLPSFDVPPGDRPCVPITQSLFWSFQLATDWRHRI